MIRDFLRYFRPIQVQRPVYRPNRLRGPDVQRILRQRGHMILVQDID